MTDTILFDLDGTLLQFAQDDFITAYFGELKKIFTRIGLDADLAVKALWSGTKTMILNDGEKLNSERFWSKFSEIMGLSDDRLKAVEAACDNFYSNEFITVKSVLKNNDLSLPCRLVRTLASKGFTIVLATNPLFPSYGVATRLSWIGLTPQDFRLITDYSNSSFCKPNLGYYREIFTKINKEPHQCLMIGNNAVEDMCVSSLGADTYLVTDYLENEANIDISVFRNGTFAELEKYIASLPSVDEKNVNN